MHDRRAGVRATKARSGVFRAPKCCTPMPLIDLTHFWGMCRGLQAMQVPLQASSAISPARAGTPQKCAGNDDALVLRAPPRAPSPSHP